MRAWSYVAVVIVVLGCCGSYLSAHAVANANDQKNQKTFDASSLEISATLELSIQHEQDLIDSTESFLIGNPHATQAQFTQWAKEVHVLGRFSDVTGLGIINYVTRAQLPAYAAREAANQTTPFKVSPPGVRPFYCLASIGLFRAGANILPKDFDVCDSSEKTLIVDARDSGKSAVLPYNFRGQEVIGLETPIYRGGGVPATTLARQHSFLEIIGLLLVPHTFLAKALVGHTDTAVALHYGSRNSSFVFRAGSVSKGAETSWVNLHDGWTLEILSSAVRPGIFGSESASAILFAGLILSLLLGALIFLLSTGRARSMLLVRDRTSQLQYQALHDALTGLPNRALIVDRMEQLLERNRRNGTFAAALFVDLDDFKNVNDSLGHAAGDHLLAMVADRMKNTLRGADTIGRMGGDEFVILIDGGDATRRSRLGGSATAQRHAPTLRPRRRPHATHNEHQHRHRRRRSPQRRPVAARRRRRSLPGQGRWQKSVRLLQPPDARRNRPTNLSRVRPARSAVGSPVSTRLPTDLYPGRPDDCGRRSALALGSPERRVYSTQRVHPDLGTHGPDT